MSSDVANDQPMAHRRNRRATAIAIALTALVVGAPGDPARAAAASPASAPEPTEPPPEAPATTADVEEPTDTTAEPAPEPGDVSPIVWIGVGALVVAAIGFAVGRSSRRTGPADEP